jgi:hypothetical protein
MMNDYERAAWKIVNLLGAEGNVGALPVLPLVAFTAGRLPAAFRTIYDTGMVAPSL